MSFWCCPGAAPEMWLSSVKNRAEKILYDQQVAGAPGTIRTSDPQIRSLSAARSDGVELNDIRSNPPICTTWPPIQRPQHQLVHLGPTLCDRDGSPGLLARLAV